MLFQPKTAPEPISEGLKFSWGVCLDPPSGHASRALLRFAKYSDQSSEYWNTPFQYIQSILKRKSFNFTINTSVGRSVCSYVCADLLRGAALQRGVSIEPRFPLTQHVTIRMLYSSDSRRPKTAGTSRYQNQNIYTQEESTQ